jgi:hypothetical protein
MIKYINFLTILTILAQPISAFEPERKLTPNEELIFAVKGIKNGVALMAGMINPIFGLMAAAYQPDEGSSDLRKIDTALRNGANINHQDAWGYTALIYAAYYGYPMIAEHLIANGARRDIREKKGYTAYEMAKYYYEDYQSRARKKTEPELDSHYQEKIEQYRQTMKVIGY